MRFKERTPATDKGIRIVLGVAWTGLALFVCVQILLLYREGLARREAGDALGWIFTREAIAGRLAPALGLLIAVCVLTAAAWICGARDRIPPVMRGKPLPPAELRAAHEKAALTPADRRTALLRAGVLAAAALLLAAGLMSGGFRDVLVKAVNLCAECVGLG